MGAEAFDDHYRALFNERWISLRHALLHTRTQVARLNRFALSARASLPPEASPIGIDGCYHAESLSPPSGRLPLPYYVMDAASVVAARALDVTEGDTVLDLCAAPGGKSLILAEGLAERGTLTVNEPSRARRARLADVLDSYLPRDVRARIRLSGHDGSRWGLHEPSHYHRVLVDAPCSSEAHVLADPKAITDWSPARPKQLAIRQGALLAAAVDSTQPGGRVVYSTCALDPRENDGVVAKILKKRRETAALEEVHAPFGAPTDLGWQILPDATGFGPIYFAVLRRI